MFNTDPEVVERAARVIPILAVSQVRSLVPGGDASLFVRRPEFS